MSLPGQGNSKVPSWVYCAANALQTSAGHCTAALGAASQPHIREQQPLISPVLEITSATPGRRQKCLNEKRPHQRAFTFTISDKTALQVYKSGSCSAVSF